MADYYTHFSKVVNHLTPEEKAWFVHALRDLEKEVLDAAGEFSQERCDAIYAAEPWRDMEALVSGWISIPFKCRLDSDRADGDYAHFYSEECGDVGALGELLSAFLARFRPEETMFVLWADTCSKPRPDAFGGGGMVVSATEVVCQSAGEWTQKQFDYHAANGKFFREM